MAIKSVFVQQPEYGLREKMYVREAVRGFAITTRHFFRNLFGKRDNSTAEVTERQGANLMNTIAYPEERRPYPPGYRGMHRLVPREDGKPRCVACYMCATVCPAQCIYIEAGEFDAEGIEKYPTRFEIDELRCIVCGFCVEACPKDAIRMDTNTHAPAVLDRSLAVFDKEALLVGPAVSHPSDELTYGKPKKGTTGGGHH
jgi:NADH-quinone oxidoreductase subunit I